MSILAINTASSQTAIALIDDEKSKIIAEKSWKSQNNEAEFLMPQIQELLKLNSQTFTDLTAVIVVKGPGSFTGLRIGVVVANTIKYLLKIKLHSINTFELLWTGLSLTQNSTDSTALLIFAGQRGVYLSKSINDTREQEVQLVNTDEIIEKLNELKIIQIFGDISENQISLLKDFKYLEVPRSFGEKILETLKTKEFLDEKTIVPIYVKAPAISKTKNKIFK